MSWLIYLYNLTYKEQIALKVWSKEIKEVYLGNWRGMIKNMI